MDKYDSGELPKITVEDFGLLQEAIHLYPELETAVLLVKTLRREQLQYPITDVEELVQLLANGEPVTAGSYVIDRDAIRRRMAVQWFPIEDETSCLMRIHLALTACREDQLAAAKDRSSPEISRAASWASIDEHGNELARGPVNP